MKKLIIDTEFKSLIPFLQPDEYALLEKSICEEGCRDAIVVWRDVIVDGHNRYDICEKYDISFQTIEHSFESRDEAKLWIITNQFARRNLSAYDRSVLALRMKDIITARAKEKQLSGLKQYRDTTVCQKSDKREIDTKKELATLAGVSHDTIAKVAKIEAQVDEMIKQKIRTNELSINQAYIDIKRNEERKKQQDRFAKLKEKELLSISDSYDVIVIDPPWDVKKIEREVAPMQVGFDYPTMTIEEITALKIPAAENSHIFLWITHKYLPFGFDIFNDWGVKYVCCFVWHKNGGFQPFGLPQYNCEFILYGRIGTPVFFDFKNFNTCFCADRTTHSEKPEEFYEILRRVTAGKRIDIYSRRNIDGFDRWGNETI